MSSMSSSDSIWLRQQLVQELKDTGVLHSPAIEQAFLTVPREIFVLTFYDEQLDSLITSEMPTYLMEVYRNRSLVTQIDQRGWPSSSSSLPAVMVKMLEALDVQPGQTVLEIGTGTGYNAALLAVLSGDPHHIVSIESDSSLAQQATLALDQAVGKGAMVLAGDGFAGYGYAGPYNRIIATASVPTVPIAWIDQLKPGGRLVMDLFGSLTSSCLVLDKTTAGVDGRFLADPLYFMPLITSNIDREPLYGLPQYSSVVATHHLPRDHDFPNNLFDQKYQWYLQWRILGCQINQMQHPKRGDVILVVDPGTKAMVLFQRKDGDWLVEIYNEEFWDLLQRTYQEFSDLGAPSRSRYQLIVEQNQPVLVVGAMKLLIARK